MHVLSWPKIILILVCSLLLTYAQNTTEEIVEEVPPEVESLNLEQEYERLRFSRLQALKEEVDQVEKDIYLLARKLKNARSFEERKLIEADIKKLEDKRVLLKITFIEIATDVDLEGNNNEGKEDLTFMDKVRELIDPLVSILTQMTERPRRLQNLKDNLENHRKELIQLDEAKRQLESMVKDKSLDKGLVKTLNRSLQVTKEFHENTKKEKDRLEFEYHQMRKEEGTLIAKISGLVLSFFKDKGKNLLLAIFAFLLIYAGLKRLRKIYLRMFTSLFSQRPWLVRPVDVLYSLLTIIASFLISIIVLYVLNDFVLVTFVMLMLVGVAWGAKDHLPVILDQAKLILNLSTVRENERVLFEGLPWRVDRLGIYCLLTNSHFEGGQIRVSFKQLMGLNSRPIVQNEAWFPFRVGDWIEYEDNFYRVSRLSPEITALQKIGGLTSYHSTVALYTAGVKNFSQDFMIEKILGVDYQHQMILESEVEKKLQDYLQQRFSSLFKNEQGLVQKLQVDIYMANESSLDFRVFWPLPGRMASHYQFITRSLQRFFISFCNENSLVIPFNQLTVHMQNEH